MSVVDAFRCWAAGVQDALAWPTSLLVIYRSSSIRSNTMKCFILNGIIFLGSLFMFNIIVRPTLLVLLRFISGSSIVYGVDDEEDTIGYSSTASSTSITDTIDNSYLISQFEDIVVSMGDFALSLLYKVLWLYPVYLISFVLNSIWYQEIADLSYRFQIGRPVGYSMTVNKRQHSILKSVSAVVADEVYRATLQLFLALQATLVNVVPVIGPLISFLYVSWLYSLYCFEYKWINQGKMLEQRLEFFESHWAYFAGFGTPFACCTFFFPQFISAGVFAMLFPSYIIMATAAGPEPEDELTGVLGRLPVFRQANWLTDYVVHFLLLKIAASSRKGTSQGSNHKLI